MSAPNENWCYVFCFPLQRFDVLFPTVSTLCTACLMVRGQEDGKAAEDFLSDSFSLIIPLCR